MTWFHRSASSAAPGRFGPLEWKVLEAMWERTGPASVRDLQPAFPEIAYTTLMTTLDRLYRKGFLARAKQGRAFLYEPRFTRGEFESTRARAALESALQGDEASLGALLSFFVRAVGDRDRELLDELEALVRVRRAEIEEARS
jgi:predicted transcriptional regulator